jgi:multimeric flavodoxin WrbA
MQVLGISSSPREKSNTVRLLSAVLDGAREGGCSTTLLSLNNYDIKYCRGCEVCYRTGSCVQKDDYLNLLELILDADGIVMSSPNYINNVTARMKAFLDRMGDVVHCQRLLGKYGAAVSTAGGSGAVEVADYLNNTMYLMGADVVGSVTVCMADGEDVFAFAMDHGYNVGLNLADAIKKGQPIASQQAGHAEMLERMKALILSRAEDWGYERGYFHTKKWL